MVFGHFENCKGAFLRFRDILQQFERFTKILAVLIEFLMFYLI